MRSWKSRGLYSPRCDAGASSGLADCKGLAAWLRTSGSQSSRLHLHFLAGESSGPCASKCRSRPTSRMLSARSRNGGQAESAQSPQRATVSKFQLPGVPLALDDGSSLHLIFALASPSLDFKSDAENCRILGDSRAACAEDSMKHPRALSLRYTKYWAQVRNIDCMLAHKQRRVTCFGWIYSSNAL